MSSPTCLQLFSHVQEDRCTSVALFNVCGEDSVNVLSTSVLLRGRRPILTSMSKFKCKSLGNPEGLGNTRVLLTKASSMVDFYTLHQPGGMCHSDTRGTYLRTTVRAGQTGRQPFGSRTAIGSAGTNPQASSQLRIPCRLLLWLTAIISQAQRIRT
jgi:hypothetical protein